MAAVARSQLYATQIHTAFLESPINIPTPVRTIIIEYSKDHLEKFMTIIFDLNGKMHSWARNPDSLTQVGADQRKEMVEQMGEIHQALLNEGILTKFQRKVFDRVEKNNDFMHLVFCAAFSSMELAPLYPAKPALPAPEALDDSEQVALVSRMKILQLLHSGVALLEPQSKTKREILEIGQSVASFVESNPQFLRIIECVNEAPFTLENLAVIKVQADGTRYIQAIRLAYSFGSSFLHN